MSRRSRKLATLASAILLAACALGVSACGSTTVSESVPKHTPELSPPNDTSAEMQAARALSQSTSSASSKSSSGETEYSTATGEGEETAESETGGVAPSEEEAEATGGEEAPAGAEAEEEPQAPSAGNTGGASAP